MAPEGNYVWKTFKRIHCLGNREEEAAYCLLDSTDPSLNTAVRY